MKKWIVAVMAFFMLAACEDNEKDLERYKQIISKNAKGFKYEEDVQAVAEVFEQYDVNRIAEDVTIVKYSDNEAQVFSNLKTETKELETGAEMSGVGRQVTVLVKEEVIGHTPLEFILACGFRLSDAWLA